VGADQLDLIGLAPSQLAQAFAVLAPRRTVDLAQLLE
jgi:hypothetical protein